MLAILPTDTCYGLAGEFTEQDYNEIYRLKGRDFGKQLAILVEDYIDMQNYIEISDEQIEFLQKYPHPWSFLGKRKKEFVLPDWMDNGKYQMLSIRVASVCLKSSPPDKGELEGVAQREIYNSVPQECFQDSLREARGVTHPNLPLSGKEEGNQIHYPLFLTSANLSGMPESKTLAEARACFPTVEGLDGGVCSQPPSDIFSIDPDGQLQYLRRNYYSM